MEADKVKACILDSARELFRRYGYNKTNVNEIARDAKVAKATIYKHFESKEMILHAILMDYIRKTVKEIITKSERDLDLDVLPREFAHRAALERGIKPIMKK